MEIYQMRYFCALVAHRHFARAAEALHISPPTLTIAIKKLESEFGIPLVDRSSASFSLTTAGKLFYSSCTGILEDIDALEKSILDISDNQRSMTLLLDHSINCKSFNDHLELFMQKHSDIDIWVKWMDVTSDKQLLTEKANVLAVIPETQLNQQLCAYHYRNCEFCVLLPNHHPLASNEQLTVSQLKQHIGEILNLDYSAMPIRLFDSEVGAAPKRLSINSNELLKTAVEFNCGIAIVPLDVIEFDRNICVRSFSPPISANYFFAHSSSQPLTHPMKELIKHFRTEL